MALTQEPAGMLGPVAVLQAHPSLQKFPTLGWWLCQCVCVGGRGARRKATEPLPHASQPSQVYLGLALSSMAFTEGETETLQVAKD